MRALVQLQELFHAKRRGGRKRHELAHSVLVIRRVSAHLHFTEMCSGSETVAYLRLIDSCITQLKAQGPSRTCNESKEEEVLLTPCAARQAVQRSKRPRAIGAPHGRKHIQTTAVLWQDESFGATRKVPPSLTIRPSQSISDLRFTLTTIPRDRAEALAGTTNLHD